MQKTFTLTAVALLLVLTVLALAPAKNLDGVIAALNSGNGTELAGYVGDKVEIGMPDKTGKYTRAQATAIFKDFFATHGVRNFKVMHKGDKGGKQFCIGELHTKSGMFRTQVLMENVDGKAYIKLISFQATG